MNAIKEYQKRLQRYCKIQHLFVPPDNDNALQKKIPSNAYIIGIIPSSSTHTSVEFAKTLSHLGISGRSRVIFILHPSKALRNQCDLCISLSSFVLQPSTLLTLLYEQIYRSYRINLNQPYHK